MKGCCEDFSFGLKAAANHKIEREKEERRQQQGNEQKDELGKRKITWFQKVWFQEVWFQEVLGRLSNLANVDHFALARVEALSPA